jgi:hypothetical protein
MKRFLHFHPNGIIIKGIPDGIGFDVLSDVCVEQVGTSLRSVSYVHLSGWKKTGAYLLLLNCNNGKQWRVIFKNAVYQLDQIPALSELPIRPGPPEYLVYHHPHAALEKYLPAVYLCEEVVPGIHYRYLLEDLSDTYQKFWKPEYVLRAVRELPLVHQGIGEWAEGIDQERLIRYDNQFHNNLLRYIEKSLTAYFYRISEEMVSKILDVWTDISELHQRREFLEMEAACPIHGDLNLSNIMFYKKTPEQIKLLDWEWAGLGIAHADLATLLKGAAPEVEDRALRTFSDNPGKLSPGEHRRLYSWCKLERSLLDAAFLAVQCMEASVEAKFNMANAVDNALRRGLQAYRELV